MALADRLKVQLTNDEGKRYIVYDDATGIAIMPGSIVKGNPTIGVGRALNVKGVSGDEIAYMLANDIEEVIKYCQDYFPWFNNLSENRQVIICDMVFQVGEIGFSDFHNFIASIKVGDFKTAYNDGLESLWAKETPMRARKLMAAFLADTPVAI